MKRYMYPWMSRNATVGQLGRLTCFWRDEVAPGDTWNGRCGLLMRFQPVQRAVLVDVHVDYFLFYVPYRLLWDQWIDYITLRGQASIPTLPEIDNTLSDNSAIFMPSGTMGS